MPFRRATLGFRHARSANITRCSKTRWWVISCRRSSTRRNESRRRDERLTYWRSQSQSEVDFVIGTKVGVEVKAGERVSPRDYKGLTALGWPMMGRR